jgi:hypothetical protein
MLHPVTGSKDAVLTAIRNAAEAFTNNNSVVQAKMADAFKDPGQREQARQTIAAQLNQAATNASQAADEPWFLPRDAGTGLAQSAMNVRLQTAPAQPVAAPGALAAAAAPALAAAPFEQFGPLDPEWIECVVDGFRTFLDGKAKFIQHQALSDFLVTIPDQTTIALVGDWGADNAAARHVAAEISAVSPAMVIHLGDIYYAGQENEAKEMLGIWPLADAGGAIPPGTSFSLNGNHEMYSGGKAYFETVLPKFGQKASYFGLRNNFWQILAFDSAYIEQRLLSPTDAAPIDARLASQWNWLVDKMKNSALPTILLSHHQPISAFADENAAAVNLRSDFQKFIAAAGRPIFGWFFGHEHRCTIYNDPNVPYFPRLIGHGSIPHAPPPANQQPDPGCASFSKMNARALPDGDAVSGFALLSFDHALIDIAYIDEDGKVFLQETWQAPAP